MDLNEHPNNYVRIPQKDLTYITLDRLVSSVLVPPVWQNVVLDCQNLQFVDPFGMIGLILVAQSYKRQSGTPLTVLLPEGNVRSYLGRAAFFRNALPFVRFVPSVEEDWLDLMDLYQGGARSLLEVTCFSESKAIPPILDRVQTALCDHLLYQRHRAFDVCIMLSEICHNVFEHNEDQAVGYVAMQAYTNRRGERFLQISVGDDGAGIPETLKRNPQYTGLKEDFEVIVKSLDNKVSRFSELTRGNGLYHLVGLVIDHQGTLTVRSGKGKVYIRGDRKRGNIFHVTHLGGTQFAITFPTQPSASVSFPSEPQI